MPFAYISLEEGERLIADLSFVIPKDPTAFHMGITNRAVFLPEEALCCQRLYTIASACR